MRKPTDEVSSGDCPRDATARREGPSFERPQASRPPDVAWDRFVARYGSFIRGYGSAIGADRSDLDELVGRVVQGFLSVHPIFDVESVRTGPGAIDHLGRAVRLALAEMRADRAASAARSVRSGAGARMDGGGTRNAEPPADPRCREVWRRIAFFRARREIARIVPPERLLAYDLAVRDRLGDLAAARILAIDATEVVARRREVQAALEAAYRRVLENPE